MWYMVAMVAPSEPALPVFIPFHLKPGLAHVTCFVWWNIKYDAGGGLISTWGLGLLPTPCGEMWSNLLEEGDPRRQRLSDSSNLSWTPHPVHPSAECGCPRELGRNQHSQTAILWDMKNCHQARVINLFFWKGPHSKYFSFLGDHAISVTGTQLCHYSVKAARGWHRNKIGVAVFQTNFVFKNRRRAELVHALWFPGPVLGQ